MLQPTVFESHPVPLNIAPDTGLLKKHVPIDVTLVRQAEHSTASPPDAVFFLGLGNEVAAAHRAAAQLVSHNVGNLAIVSAFPYWKMAPTAAAMERLAIEGSHAVMRTMHELHSNGDAANGRPVIHAAAESQQGPSLGWGASRAPELYTGRMAWLRTLALQGEMSEGEFTKAGVATAFQSDQWRHPGFLRVGLRGAFRVQQDKILNKGAGLDFALSADLGNALQTLADMKGVENLLVVSVDKDKIFKAEKQYQTLKSLGLGSIWRVIRGSHTPPCMPPGAKQVVPVVHWLRTGVFPVSTHGRDEL